MSDQDHSALSPPGTRRIASYLQQDRESGLHPAVQTLHQRPAARRADANRRVVEFARIERGHSV